MTDIAGRAAFVTGGGSGIGRAIAVELAREGAAVAVADVLMDNAGAVTEEILAAGGRAAAIVCDVTDRTSIRRAKEEAIAALGDVSLLFAVAGVSSWQRLVEMSDDDVDWIFQVNLMGVVDCVRMFVPDMIAAGDGHVLGTASVAGLLPAWLPSHCAYSSAKLGVIGLMLNLRMELSEAGVGCTVYCPSSVASRMAQNQPRARPTRFGSGGDVQAPPNVRQIFKDAGRVPRPPEEVAPYVLRAVRENRPLVFNSTQDRLTFQETYVDLVMEAFAEVEEFERGAIQGP